MLGEVEAANADDFSVGAVIVLALMLAGFVFYMAFDAMRVAQARSTGERINDPDQFEKVLGSQGVKSAPHANSPIVVDNDLNKIIDLIRTFD